MSKVQQAAGGGKVTVEGLTADVVQSGKTVTVRQGSKVVRQVAGTLKVARITVGSTVGSVDIKALLPDVWQRLTTGNFAFGTCGASFSAGSYATCSKWNRSVSVNLSYDAGAGILTVSGSNSLYDGGSASGYWKQLSCSLSVVCYYC